MITAETWRNSIIWRYYRQPRPVPCPPVRRGPPEPAWSTIVGDWHTDDAIGRDDAHSCDGQAGDQLDGDRRGDGDPRVAFRAISDNQAETYTLIRKVRACRRQRHADAGGRFQGGSSKARGGSEHRSFVIARASPAPDICRAGRLTSFGSSGRPLRTHRRIGHR
jgi:hypothetical protein